MDDAQLPDLSVLEQKASDGEFEPVPPGLYNGLILSIKLQPNQANDKWAFNVEFLITGPKYANRHVWDNVWLTNLAAWRLQQLLQAVGLDDLADKDLSNISPGTLIDKIEGRPCRAMIVHDSYEGKTQVNVKKYMTADESSDSTEAKSPMSPI